MNVDELREAIKDAPGDWTVILAKDGEGNNYSPLADAEVDEARRYEPDSTWSGEIIDLTESDYNEQPRTPEDIQALKDITRACVILWPIN